MTGLDSAADQEKNAATSIVFTEGAARKVQSMLKQEEDPNQSLRVYITGGGCAGFSYGFKFDSNRVDEDTSIERDGVVLVIDSLSIQYLAGSTIDYQENLMGSRFVVENPNATTTCGCGSSFSV